MVYAGAEQHIFCWNIEAKALKSKWKAGNEKITAILVLSDESRLLTASKNIKLWNVKKKELLKTFTGHSYEVNVLESIRQNDCLESYFISGSKVIIFSTLPTQTSFTAFKIYFYNKGRPPT